MSLSDLCLVTADLVAPILSFLAEVAKEPLMKDWLGRGEGNIFWPCLMTLLCSQPAPPKYPGSPQRHHAITPQQRALIETAAVSLFAEVIAGHSVNQHLFAEVLCETIRNQGSVQSGPGLNFNAIPLSGFTRRLFLQVLLEDEHILVAFKSTSALQKTFSSRSSSVYHPKFGAGHHCKVVKVGLPSTCGELLNMVTGKLL